VDKIKKPSAGKKEVKNQPRVRGGFSLCLGFKIYPKPLPVNP